MPFSSYPVAGVALSAALILLLLFREFIFSGKMLLAHDVIESAIPYLKYLKDYFLAHGAIPLWDPYRFCGLPFVDAIHGHAGALYPFTFISLIGSIPRAIGFNMILHYLAACVFAYMAAREIGLRPLVATFVGFAYGLSPTLISWVLPGHDGKLFVAAWMPLAVYLAERLRKSPSLPLIAGLGLVVAVSIMTPHLQAVLYVLILLLFYSLANVVFDVVETQTAGRNLRFIGAIAVAAVIGLSVSSVQWIPAYRHISEFSPRAENERGVEWADTYSLNGEELVSIVLPEFAGVNIIGRDYSYWGKNPFKDNSEAVGVLACVLAIMAMLVPGYRRQKIIWASITILVVLYSLGNSTPLFKLILAVFPPLDRMRAPSTSMFVAVFAIAMLAGIGLQNVSDAWKDGRVRSLGLARNFMIGCSVLFLLLWLISLVAGESLISFFVGIIHPEIVPSAGSTPEGWKLGLNNLSPLRIGLFFGTLVSIGATLALFFGSTKKWHWQRLSVVIVLLVVGSYQFDQKFIISIPPEGIFGETPVSRYLQSYQDKDRTLGYPVPTRWYQLGYHGIYSPAGVNDKAMAWSFDLLGGRAHTHLLNPRIVNLTGTRYIVTPSNQQISQYALGPEPLQPAMPSGPAIVHKNSNASPRVYFVHTVRVFENPEELYDSIQAGTEDLRRIAYLERPISLPYSQPDTIETASARIATYSAESVEISVHATRERLLILTDTYHPNWKAYVDDRETEVLRVYGAFRAVVVPAGSSNVAFRYEDSLHDTTSIISLLSLAVCVAFFGIGWYRRRT